MQKFGKQKLSNVKTSKTVTYFTSTSSRFG